MEFIQVLIEKKIPIGLIHYNDSKVQKGVKRDLHAPIGRGYIGFKSLFKVIIWANQNEIPCLTE